MALSRMAEKLQCCSRAASVPGASGHPRKVLRRCAVPRRSWGRSTVSTGHQQGRGQGWGHSGAHLVQLLVGDIEDVQEVPLAQPALDMVKPGAVVHWGEVGGDGRP